MNPPAAPTPSNTPYVLGATACTALVLSWVLWRRCRSDGLYAPSERGGAPAPSSPGSRYLSKPRLPVVADGCERHPKLPGFAIGAPSAAVINATPLERAVVEQCLLHEVHLKEACLRTAPAHDPEWVVVRSHAKVEAASDACPSPVASSGDFEKLCDALRSPHPTASTAAPPRHWLSDWALVTNGALVSLQTASATQYPSDDGTTMVQQLINLACHAARSRRAPTLVAQCFLTPYLSEEAIRASVQQGLLDGQMPGKPTETNRMGGEPDSMMAPSGAGLSGAGGTVLPEEAFQWFRLRPSPTSQAVTVASSTVAHLLKFGSAAPGIKVDDASTAPRWVTMKGVVVLALPDGKSYRTYQAQVSGPAATPPTTKAAMRTPLLDDVLQPLTDASERRETELESGALELVGPTHWNYMAPTTATDPLLKSWLGVTVDAAVQQLQTAAPALRMPRGSGELDAETQAAVGGGNPLHPLRPFSSPWGSMESPSGAPPRQASAALSSMAGSKTDVAAPAMSTSLSSTPSSQAPPAVATSMQWIDASLSRAVMLCQVDALRGFPEQTKARSGISKWIW